MGPIRMRRLDQPDDRRDAAKRFVFLDIPGRSTVPPGRRGEDAIEPDAGQIGMARPVQPRRPGPETTGRLAAGRADDLLQGFGRERIEADKPKSRGACLAPGRRDAPSTTARAGRRHWSAESRSPWPQDPLGDRRRRRIVALIEATGLARAGTVGCQPVEHDVEEQPQAVALHVRGDLTHRLFGRSGNAQPGRSPPDRKSGTDRRRPAQRSARRRDGRNPVERHWRRAGANPAGKRHFEGGDNKSWAYKALTPPPRGNRFRGQAQ